MRSVPLTALLAVLLLSIAVRAAEPAPGLVLELRRGEATDVRVAPSVALYVPAGEAVSPFLEPGPFQATFSGTLNLEKRSRLVFTLEGTGTARLLVDGEPLVEAIGQSNDSKRLSSGAHPFVIEYESPAEGAAQLRLFWEERDFAREPVPTAVLRHDPGEAALQAHRAVRSGRLALAEKRCLACHESPVAAIMPELNLKAPSLDEVGARLHQGWLAKWIANPSALRPSAHMPVVFREDAEGKAADVAAYLAAGAKDPGALPEVGAAQLERGGHLFHEQGCIACHSLDERGDAERIGLKAIGRKFRPGALAAFLREPAKHHEATRMPTFGFSEEEAAALEGFLRSLESAPAVAAPAGDVERGRALFTRSGCLDCHERGDEQSTLAAGPAFADLGAGECAQMSYDSGLEGSGLAEFVARKSAHESLGRAVPAEFAQRQYEALNCNACHARNGSIPLREQFADEVAHLKPPAPALDEEKPALKVGAPPLNHLGLKLRPEWRTRLFQGEIDPKIRPWLPARMPAFPSRAEPLSTGFSHAAGVPATSPATAELDPEKVRIGEAMTGVQGGLACGTCHGIGDKPPIAVFEGEGPNLRDAGARLRREYFHLWMTDPPRVWPGTIMPKYAVDGQTPLTQHYDGDAHKQFEAIYEYLRALSQK